MSAGLGALRLARQPPTPPSVISSSWYWPVTPARLRSVSRVDCMSADAPRADLRDHLTTNFDGGERPWARRCAGCGPVWLSRSGWSSVADHGGPVLKARVRSRRRPLRGPASSGLHNKADQADFSRRTRPHYANRALNLFKNLGTSKLWVTGSSPVGRAISL
jgi:hypothetical protein